MFGGSGEEQAAAAAYVEDLLIALPRVQGEDEVAVAELAELYVEEKERSFE
jgi:hypothetical protein